MSLASRLNGSTLARAFRAPLRQQLLKPVSVSTGKVPRYALHPHMRPIKLTEGHVQMAPQTRKSSGLPAGEYTLL
jgi:hypothetical protein